MFGGSRHNKLRVFKLLTLKVLKNSKTFSHYVYILHILKTCQFRISFKRKYP